MTFETMMAGAQHLNDSEHSAGCMRHLMFHLERWAKLYGYDENDRWKIGQACRFLYESLGRDLLLTTNLNGSVVESLGYVFPSQQVIDNAKKRSIVYGPYLGAVDSTGKRPWFIRWGA